MSPVKGHVFRTLDQRLTEKVDKTDGCWLWLGFLDKAGYGRIRLGGRDTEVGYAHRVSYEMNVGPIPDGLVLDHLCRNTRCVNPAHLEPVTQRENIMRGERGDAQRTDRCVRGHGLVEYGYTSPKGKRSCRKCRRLRRAVGV